jgi:yeast amino acid transporter
MELLDARAQCAVLGPAHLPTTSDSINNDRYVKPVLRRTLNSWHIWLITISGTLGAGLFNSSSYALSVAGPGGALIAFAIVGLVAITVMECICEMTLIWPIPNAMVEYVAAFVDKDLSIVVGVAYWFAYATAFAAFNINAANLLDYWGISDAWKSILFVAIPILILMMNTRQVEVFGIIQSIGGVLKLLLIAALVIELLVVNAGVGGSHYIGSKYLDDGIQADQTIASSRGAAICMAMSIATFSYFGIEIAAVTAFEARKPHTDLKKTSQNIAPLVAVIYLLTTLMFSLDVQWSNSLLPSYNGLGMGQLVSGNDSLSTGNSSSTMSYSAPVVAMRAARLSGAVWTAFFVFFMLSSANTALYVASRAFYGMTRSLQIDSYSSWFERTLAATAVVQSTTLSPEWPLLISALLFFWLPFIRLDTGYSRLEVQEILINIGSTCLVLVWASQCLAYLRYHQWRTYHHSRLTGPFFSKYRRFHDTAGRFATFQPVLAWFGLISTLSIAMVFNSAAMWNGKNLGAKFGSAYIGPILCLTQWLLLKLLRYYRCRHSLSFGVNLRLWEDFAKSVRRLSDLVYPQDFPVSTDLPDDHNRVSTRQPVPKDEGTDDGTVSMVLSASRRTDDLESVTSNTVRPRNLELSEKEEGPPGDFVPSSLDSKVGSARHDPMILISRSISQPQSISGWQSASNEKASQPKCRAQSLPRTPEIVLTTADTNEKMNGYTDYLEL